MSERKTEKNPLALARRKFEALKMPDTENRSVAEAKAYISGASEFFQLAREISRLEGADILADEIDAYLKDEQKRLQEAAPGDKRGR